MKFENFMYVKYAYIQSKEALSCGADNLSFFEHCYSNCLMSAIGQITSLKSFCHPGILMEWQNGGDRAKQFISSMKVYLENGRNLTDTAKKLNIHRNTLSYRLERMGELLGFDLNSDLIDSEYLSLLITSCQIVLHLSETVPGED